MTKKKTAWFALLFIVVLLVIDQIIKIAVKTNMHLYESIWITDWFQIHFIENNGMAFGLSFINKYVLTIFRIVAVTLIGIYLHRQIQQGARTIYIVLLSLLLAGAAGNIIDCLFYFDFPLIVTTWPDWMPFWGGDEFIFFSPVFNFADACVSVSVVALFLFCRPELATLSVSNDEESSEKDVINEESTEDET